MSKPRFLKTFLEGEAHFWFGGVLSKSIGIANTIIVLSTLSLYEYGVAQLLIAAYSSLTFFMGLGSGSVNAEFFRYIGSGNIAKVKALFYQSTVLRVVVAGVLFAALYWGGFYIFANRFSPDFASLLKVVAFFFLSNAMSLVVQPILKGAKRFKALAIRVPLERAVHLSFLIFFVFVLDNFGIKQFLFSVAFSSIVANATLLPTAWIEFKKWGAVKAEKANLLLPILTGVGKWDIARPFFGKAVALMQPVLIKLFISTEAVAIFSVAKNIVASIEDFFPIRALSALVQLNASNRYLAGRTLIYGTKYLAIFSIMLIVLGYAFVPILIGTFFEQYIPSLLVFRVLIWNLLLSALGVLPIVYLVAFRRQRFIFIHSAISSLMALTSYVFLLPVFGLVGLAYERLVTPSFMLILTGVYLYRKIPELDIPWSRFVIFDHEDSALIKRVYLGIRSRMPTFGK